MVARMLAVINVKVTSLLRACAIQASRCGYHKSAPCIFFTGIDFEELDEAALRKLFVGMTRATMKLGRFTQHLFSENP